MPTCFFCWLCVGGEIQQKLDSLMSDVLTIGVRQDKIYWGRDVILMLVLVLKIRQGAVDIRI